jgi:hypothetical protein
VIEYAGNVLASPLSSTMSPASRTHPLKVGTKYRTYKIATDKLASWLGNTVASLLPSGQEPKPGYSISLFITYTELITAARPIIQVPSDIIDAAYNAFLARHETATVLQGTDIESDSRHQHVISIIANVLKKLRDHSHAAKSTQKAKAKEAPPLEEEKDSPIPSFKLLQVEAAGDSDDEHDVTEDIGPREILTKAQKAKLQKKKKKARQKAQATQQVYFLDDYDDDPYFVLMCLLSDLRSMRKYIKEIWQEYKDGKVDLVTVSLTTNATFDIIRTYEDDFPAISSLLSDYSKSMELMLSRKLGKSDSDFIDLLFNPMRDWTNQVRDIEIVARSLAKIPTFADLTLANAFYFLKRPRYAFMISTKDYSKQDEDTAQRSKKMKEVASLEEDISILGLFSLRLCEATRHFYEGIRIDHFTMQWIENLSGSDDKTITLAHVFGAQMYLDMHHVLRLDCKRGNADLSEAIKRYLQTIRAWREDLEREDYLTSKIKYQMNWNTKFIETTITMLSEIKTVTLPTSATPENSYVEALMPFSALQMNPLLSGIISFQILHMQLYVGLYLAQNLGSIKHVGQLYYMCQLHRELYMDRTVYAHHGTVPQYRLPLHWNDMEEVFKMYGKESFFCGRSPMSNKNFTELVLKSLKDVRDSDTPDKKSTWMVPGQGKIQFAKNVCSHEPIALMHRLFFAKYGRFTPEEKDNPLCDWTLETLQAHCSIQDETDGDKRGGQKLTTEKNRDVSQLSILRDLKATLQKESRILHFDFLSLHTRCLEFVRGLRGEYRDILKRMKNDVSRD